MWCYVVAHVSIFYFSIESICKLNWCLLGTWPKKLMPFLLLTNWGTDGGGPDDNDCEEAKFSLLLCFNEVRGIRQLLPKLSVSHDYLGICDSLDICFPLVDKNVTSRLLHTLCIAVTRRSSKLEKQSRLSVHVWTLYYVQIGGSVQWCSREFGLQTISNHSTTYYWGQKYMHATPVLTSVLLFDD